MYNGGLAFGVFGFFVYDLLYKTFGVTPPQVVERTNEIYDRFGHNYQFYGTMFFLTIFVLCIVVGYYLNGNSFSGYRKFLKDTGHSSNFAAQYGMPLCLINLGFYGIFFLTYINLIISLTPGAGFTGATVGVILASLTFTAVGQHPKNVWPILAGYMLLYIVTQVICYMDGREIAWSISTQGYINGVAFATGLCPIIGRYGVRAGIAAGFLCASMCTATRDLHGGLVLYNGGFTAGITALILLPILEHYIPAAREELKEQKIDFRSMITLVYPNTSEKKKADRKQPTF